ncbi:T9SS type A sorting domain-containing protein [Mariniflexile gromovii]|uniref:T9SS type A sorting domain-containing protein n=1 Tax=Mariniflexile gromovii TaxID=362523 RepID=A0ABS4BXU4_9FLAO|nr:T9SS type A sorting domain-containing protein [Mariniflexile gromovii]MBP0905407.1 T9SS type A sorting domain-containing protein [Mariniflexile gromovii]
MRQKLLLTKLFLFTTFFISAQAIITTDNNVEQFKSPEIPGIQATAVTGVFSIGANNAYYQLRGDAAIKDDLSGKLTFDIATASGSIDGKLSFDFRKLYGSVAEITVTVDGYTPQTFSLPADGTSSAFTPQYFIDFTETITFTSTPLKITFDITDLDQGNQTGITNSRLYNVVIDKSTLSTNNFIKNSFNLYPNPTTNSFEIRGTKEINNVQVYSVNGRLLKTLTPTTKYDISDLASGLYLITINTLSGSETMKLIKK